MTHDNGNERASVTVRKARVEDMGPLLQMIRALAAHHGDEAQISAANLWRDVFCAQPWVYVLVAEGDGDGGLLGYAALAPRVQLQFARRGADLHHLFVHHDKRGQGVGQALIRAARTHAAGQGCSYLVVGTDAGRAAGASLLEPADRLRSRLLIAAPSRYPWCRHTDSGGPQYEL